MESGKLFIIGTPIGNLEDMTLRAVKTLYSVELLLCEDTRVTSKLLNLIQDSRFMIQAEKQVKPRLERFDENVERLKTPRVLAWLKEGKKIGLVTDAGMPGVSDPGSYLVGKCYEAEVPVAVIPGPSALTTAMALAGIQSPQVTFLGFLPKKLGKRIEIIKHMRELNVIYESPYRIRQTLIEIEEQLKDPNVVAMSELTKMHEKVIRGKASDVLKKLDGELPASAKATVRLKGEWVVVVKV